VTRGLRSLLFEIEPTDPVTFVGTAAAVLLMAALAALVPAIRAMRTDPVAALRAS
jgi:putative ABC transport system permease protein